MKIEMKKLETIEIKHIKMETHEILKWTFFFIIKNTIEIHYILWGTIILRWRVQIPCILVYSTNKNDNNLDLYYFICLYQSKLINLIMDNLNHQVKK
jgi:uncharacterized membrane protein